MSSRYLFSVPIFIAGYACIAHAAGTWALIGAALLIIGHLIDKHYD
jgi:hypothetical protein